MKRKYSAKIGIVTIIIGIVYLIVNLFMPLNFLSYFQYLIGVFIIIAGVINIAMAKSQERR